MQGGKLVFSFAVSISPFLSTQTKVVFKLLYNCSAFPSRPDPQTVGHGGTQPVLTTAPAPRCQGPALIGLRKPPQFQRCLNRSLLQVPSEGAYRDIFIPNYTSL